MLTYSFDKLADNQEIDNLIPDNMEDFLDLIDMQPVFHRKLTLRALKIKNIQDPMDLLVKTSHELVNLPMYFDSHELKNISRLKFQINSNPHYNQKAKYLDTQMDILNQELASGYMNTGVNGSGFRSKSIIGINGLPSSYQATFCKQISLRVMQSEKKGGWNRKVLYISSFLRVQPQDLVYMNKYHKLSETRLKKNFVSVRLETLKELDDFLLNLSDLRDYGLIIIDNMADFIETRYPGTNQLGSSEFRNVGDREVYIHSILSRLRSITNYFNSLAIIVNKSEYKFAINGSYNPDQHVYQHKLAEQLESYCDLILEFPTSTRRNSRDLDNQLLPERSVKKYERVYQNWFKRKCGYILIRCTRSRNHSQFEFMAMWTPFGLFEFSSRSQIDYSLYRLLLQDLDVKQRYEKQEARRQRKRG